MAPSISVEKQVRKLLEAPRWIPTLETMTAYQRVQDDNDGDLGQRLDVVIGVDGDMHISILGKKRSLRFRNGSGGGQSLRVHNALMILAEAIRLDNEERPQSNVNLL